MLHMAMEKIKKRNMCFVTRVVIGYKFINVDSVNRVELCCQKNNFIPLEIYFLHANQQFLDAGPPAALQG